MRLSSCAAADDGVSKEGKTFVVLVTKKAFCKSQCTLLWTPMAQGKEIIFFSDFLELKCKDVEDEIEMVNF